MITAIIVGAGHRSIGYAAYALEHPENLQIVGVAEPDAIRRDQIAKRFNLNPDQCYLNAAELAARGKKADAIINGTMDHQHVPTSIPLLNAGYDMLLEKPFAISLDEMQTLISCVRKNNSKLFVCHVLRYAPFYTEIKKLLAQNAIGEIMNIQATEHVSYHHFGVAYVRGKWNNTKYGVSSTLMAKSCHDLDLINWFKSPVSPVRVSSFGSLMYFKRSKAPKNAGTRCLVDCPIEKTCRYSARKHYIDHPERWGTYVWHSLEHIENPTIDDKIKSLQGDNPFGRCVWKCDNNVVDHQTVMIEFKDGATASLNMLGGATRPMRKIHIIGTHGEIQGVMDESKFVVRHFDTRAGKEYQEKEVDLMIGGDMTGAFGGHGGGDLRMVEDFVNVLSGKKPSISCTSIDDSINGHLIGFLADKSREENGAVQMCSQSLYNLNKCKKKS